MVAMEVIKGLACWPPEISLLKNNSHFHRMMTHSLVIWSLSKSIKIYVLVHIFSEMLFLFFRVYVDFLKKKMVQNTASEELISGM